MLLSLRRFWCGHDRALLVIDERGASVCGGCLSPEDPLVVRLGLRPLTPPAEARPPRADSLSPAGV